MDGHAWTWMDMDGHVHGKIGFTNCAGRPKKASFDAQSEHIQGQVQSVFAGLGGRDGA